MTEQQDACAKKQTNDDEDRAQRFEELRFAKKQQWAVATAVVTLLGAIFALQHAADAGPSPREKVALAVIITLIATLGCSFLVMLQNYMRDTRRLLDPRDQDAWLRGTSILGVLIGVIILSAFSVLYVAALR
jgi:hypothetical protein